MVNKVILIGNVGMDPEVRAMEGGVKVARIRLATTERYRDRQSNENKEHTEWHTITLWRGLADVVDNYVRKGSQIYVEGRLRTREWTDQQGNKRYATDIIVDEAYFVDSKNGSVGGDVPEGPQGQSYMPEAYQASVGQNAANFEEINDDGDLPF